MATPPADLDRERIHRKPVLSGLINEYTPPDTRRLAGHQADPIFERDRAQRYGPGSQRFGCARHASAR